MYVTQDIVQDVREVVHEPTLSDHKAVIMKVELAFTVPARTQKVGTWKLNCSILRDKDIQEPAEAQQDVAGFEQIKERIVQLIKDFFKIRSGFHKTTFTCAP